VADELLFVCYEARIERITAVCQPDCRNAPSITLIYRPSETS